MSKRLNILHLPKWYPYPEDPQLGIFIKNQVDALSPYANQYVLSVIGSSKVNIITINENTSDHLIELQVLYPASGSPFKRLKNYLKAVETGLSKLANSEFRPDIIHGHITGRNIWVARKYFKTIPYIISEHWSGYIDGRFEKMSSWKKKRYLKYLNQAKQIIAVSPYLAEAIKNKGVSEQISIVNNIIKVDVAEQEKEKDFTFLMVNDLIDRTKNVSGAIKAFRQIKITFPSTKLQIIGDGKDREKLETLVKELQLDNAVLFLGRMDQNTVLQHYGKVNCVIVNSNFETYSMVTAEAILSGIPVIATRCGGPEQFINTQNGFLISKSNIDELVFAMKQMITNQNEYKSAAVKSSISTSVSPEIIAKSLLSIYSK